MKKPFFIALAILFFCGYFLLLPGSLRAQWVMTYGSGGNDDGYVIIPTSDNGYLIAGATNSFGVGGLTEGSDILLIKIDGNGEIEWQKIFGTAKGDDEIHDAKELPGGGYLLVGQTWVVKGSVYGHAALAMVIEPDGDLIWSKLFYFSTDFSHERALAIQPTSDGNYLLKCYFSGSLPSFYGTYFLKINAEGDLLWAKGNDTLVPLADGSFFMVEGLYSGFRVGLFDANFNYVAHQNFSDGSSDYHDVFRVLKTSDGGYLVQGVIEDDPTYTTETKGYFIVKLSSGLNIIWQKFYPDTGVMLSTNDGGVLVFFDEALHKIDSNGEMEWEKKFTGYTATEIIETGAGDGYMVLGQVSAGGEGGRELMLLQVDLNGNLDPSCPFGEGTATVVTDLGLVPTFGPPPDVGNDLEIYEKTPSLVVGTPEMVPHLVCPSQPYIYLSPFQRIFGADGDGSGAVTEPQQVLVRNTGAGLMNWSAESMTGRLSVTPSSGADEAYLTISVDPSGLSPGEYVGTVAVTCADAYNSPKNYEVKLRVYGGSYKAESPPFGSFDTPIDGSTVSGSVPITGWALDDIQVSRVIVKRSSHPDDPPEVIGPDGLVYIGDALFVKGARPDVKCRYYGYPLAERAGWGYMLLTNLLPGGGNGDFTLYAIAEDVSGNQVILGEKKITCDNASRTKPFGTIDTPAQGEKIGGSAYINFGWALTPPPKEIPRDGSTIWVWLDGVPLGHPDYNHYRVDIATLFPGYLNSDAAVGFYYIDTTTFDNDLHSLAWSVMDNWGETEGIGSRWIEIFNDGGGSALSSTGGGALGVLGLGAGRGDDLIKEAFLPEDRSGRLKIELVGWRKGWDAFVAGSSKELVSFESGAGFGVRGRQEGEKEETEEMMRERKIEVKEREVSLNITQRMESARKKRENLVERDVIREMAGRLAELTVNEGERFEIHLRPQGVQGGEGGIRVVGWGQSKGVPLPPGSYLDRERGVFYWMPGPGMQRRFLLHFAATDGFELSRPVTVVVKIGVY